jgi:hypothetical protein
LHPERTGQHAVSPSTHDRAVAEIARELERYVDCHPAAADTIDGIARWWLAGPVQPPLRDVEAAIDLLVRHGVLSRNPLPDGNTVYARARKG